MGKFLNHCVINLFERLSISYIPLLDKFKKPFASVELWEKKTWGENKPVYSNLLVQIHPVLKPVSSSTFYWLHVFCSKREFLYSNYWTSVYTKVFWITLSQDFWSYVPVINKHTGPNKILSDREIVSCSQKMSMSHFYDWVNTGHSEALHISQVWWFNVFWIDWNILQNNHPKF